MRELTIFVTYTENDKEPLQIECGINLFVLQQNAKMIGGLNESIFYIIRTAFQQIEKINIIDKGSITIGLHLLDKNSNTIETAEFVFNSKEELAKENFKHHLIDLNTRLNNNQNVIKIYNMD